MVTLEQAMSTNLKKISCNSSLVEAAKQMRAEGIGALLIERIGKLLRDREGQIVGLITETDIIRKAVAEEVDLANHTVEQMMTTPMITVEITWPLEDAYDMMKDSGVRHLLVSKDQIIVGLVSLRDLLVHLKR
jgi:signal-transduction protein with cAMP-binding, CBS, and nucleotidyltransferase domain